MDTSPAPASDLLGRLAVHYGMITMEQLAVATREQSHTPELKLGEILVSLGFVQEAQLSQLLAAQRQYLAATKSAVERRRIASMAPPAPAAVVPPAPPAPAPAPVAAPVVAPDKVKGLPRHPTPRMDPARVEAQVKWLNKVLARGVEMHASDIHIRSGSPLKARVFQSLVNLTPEAVSSQQIEAVLLSAMSPDQRELFLDNGELDFAYFIEGIGRFRVNAYNQHTGPCGVFHFIPAEPPLLADLGLPNHAARLVGHQNGLVLITGPAGSGKTSTMAALTNLLNEERTDHVLSVEDPIEYLHTSKRCVVNQRQINRHTRSFAAALKSALREDPDVICIGEMRDLETISLALSAAETGHLVLGTLHTQGAIRTINRIVGAYPSGQQPQVRTMLSESLRAVVSQKLIPRADLSGMALAYEMMFITLAAANMIRENRTFQLQSVLQTGKHQGMRALDDSLMELVNTGAITKAQAALNADRPETFL